MVVANRHSLKNRSGVPRSLNLAADGYGTAEIRQATGKAKPVIRRWQECFRDERAAALWRDETRPSRIAPLGPEGADQVVARPHAGGSAADGQSLGRLGNG
jgi:hypothetical protein